MDSASTIDQPDRIQSTSKAQLTYLSNEHKIRDQGNQHFCAQHHLLADHHLILPLKTSVLKNPLKKKILLYFLEEKIQRVLIHQINDKRQFLII